MKKFRQICRLLHRDLSYFFSGVILIYAFSGFMLNHKKDFNSNYSITRKEYRAEGSFPKTQKEFTEEYVLQLLKPLGEDKNYTKHYFPSEGEMKAFIKGGSSLVVEMQTGKAVYESLKKRPVLSTLNRLHYNPNRNWTLFSDLFVLSLAIITLTGIIMVKGPKGLWGRGGVELIAGILIPLIFIFLL